MRSFPSSLAFFALVWPTLSTLMVDEQDAKSKATGWRSPVAAPIHYTDIAVILADDNGVACVKFLCPPAIERKQSATSELVEYHYRYRANDGTEKCGEGLLFENQKQVDADEGLVVDDGGRTKLLAGHFQLEWSQGDMSQGWLYYTPEKLRMQFAALNHFDKLDLSRFVR